MSTQSEALRLADALTTMTGTQKDKHTTAKQAAVELRRLHAINADLLEALKSERALRVIGQHPDVHWESLRDMRRSVYAATDAALAKAEGREA